MAVFNACRIVHRVPNLTRHHLLAHQGIIDGKLLTSVRRNGLNADILPAPETVHKCDLLLRQDLEGPGTFQPHADYVPADPI